MARDCTFLVLRDIFIRHSAVLSLPAVLLRKVPSIGEKTEARPAEAVPQPSSKAVRQLGAVREKREDRRTAAESLLSSQRPSSWRLSKSINPQTKKRLL